MKKIQAKNNYVWVIRDNSEDNIGGMVLADSAIKKATSGLIYSVGDLCADKSIKEGQTAIFHKQNGSDVSYDGIDYTVLREDQVLGCA